MRARILEELAPDQPYREVRAAILPDVDYHGAEEEQLRQAMLELAARLPPRWRRVCSRRPPERRVARWPTWWPRSVVADVERRQDLLCELDVRARLRAVLAEVSEVLARLAPAKPEGR